MIKTAQDAIHLPTEFEDEFTNGLKELFEEKIVFNKTLGLKITSLRPDSVAAQMAMRPDLIGHYAHSRIHGGAVSAALDAVGGLAVMVALGARHMDELPAQRLLRFLKLGTIDMRVDYLRAGIAKTGDVFELRAEVLRLGSRVARDALHNSMRCVRAQDWATCGVAFLANSLAIGLRNAPCSSSQPALHPFAASYAEHP